MGRRGGGRRHVSNLLLLLIALTLLGATTRIPTTRILPAATGRVTSPATALHLLQRGRAARASGDLPRARILLTQAIRVAPTWGIAYLELGFTAHLAQPGCLAAIAALDKAAELAPNNARVHYYRGIVLQHAGHTANAAQAFTRALALRHDLIDAWYRLATCERQAGHADETVRALQKVLEHDRHHLGALLALAQLHEDRGELDAAESALLRIVQDQPHVAYHRYRLAQFYARIGESSKAQAAFRRADDLDPRPPERKMRDLR